MGSSGPKADPPVQGCRTETTRWTYTSGNTGGLAGQTDLMRVPTHQISSQCRLQSQHPAATCEPETRLASTPSPETVLGFVQSRQEAKAVTRSSGPDALKTLADIKADPWTRLIVCVWAALSKWHLACLPEHGPHSWLQGPCKQRAASRIPEFGCA